MAGRTRAGAQQAAREELGLPKSMAALRLSVIASIKMLRRLEATCFSEQSLAGLDDGEPYGSVDPAGPKLSYGDYRKALAEKERRLRDATPPDVWRPALKRAEEELVAEMERPVG